MTDMFTHPWFSGLFGDDEIESIWSAERALDHMLAFEAAYSRGLGEVGTVSTADAQAAADLITRTRPSLPSLQAGTMEDGLPVPALVRSLRSEAGPLAAAIHTGTTSQDVMDTALAMTLQETSGLLQSRLSELSAALDGLTARFGARNLMGRTRMQAALPIVVSHRLANWNAPLVAHQKRLETLRPGTECVQLSGPVGDGQTLGPRQAELAAFVAATLGLNLPDHNWHTDRAGLVEYAGLLSLLTGSLGKMGQDICLMALQGIDEISLSGGGTSSAMPHKQNPILAELLVTLARFNATQVSAMHQCLVHEQERSGSAWSLEWMILPNMAKATARSLSAAQALCTQITSIGRDAET